MCGETVSSGICGSGTCLKLPAGSDSRRELQAPLGQPDHVPAELLDHLAVFTRGRELSPVARLSTRRATYPGSMAPPGSTSPTSPMTACTPSPCVTWDRKRIWREWELELVHATSELFTAAQPALEAAGGAVGTEKGSVLRRRDRLCDALRQVRKDAKRLRHAAESVTGIHGKSARVLEKTGAPDSKRSRRP